MKVHHIWDYTLALDPTLAFQNNESNIWTRQLVLWVNNAIDFRVILERNQNKHAYIPTEVIFSISIILIAACGDLLNLFK